MTIVFHLNVVGAVVVVCGPKGDQAFEVRTVTQPHHPPSFHKRDCGGRWGEGGGFGNQVLPLFEYEE